MSNWYAMGPSNATDTAFKLKKDGTYRASNVMFDPERMVATSFDWWYFVKRIGGKVVFNDYSYSSYTTRHQSKVRRTMQALGIKVDVTIEARKGLQSLDVALRDYDERVKTLLALIQKPGTRKAKNEERKLEVKELLEKIETVKDLIRKESQRYAN